MSRSVRLSGVLALLLMLVVCAACGSDHARPSAAPATPGASSSGRSEAGRAAPALEASTPPSFRHRKGRARPNVMVVMMDDMRSDELQYIPNVRRYVRDRGLHFTNSFSPYPLCCPARSSFLLGQYAHNHGVLFHRSPYGFGSIDDSRTIATAMKASGYRTAMVGKYLNLYGVQRSRVTGRSSVRYVPAGWDNWMTGLDTIWPVGSPYAGNTYDYFSFTQNINGTVVLHPGQYSSDVVGNEVNNLLGGYAKGPRKPWFMWVTPVAPHFGGPLEPDDPKDYTEADGRVQNFATPARPDSVKGRFDTVLTHAPGTRVHGPSEADVSDKPRNISRFLETTPTENRRVLQIERQRAESLYVFDRNFGRMVAKLKQTHQWRNTLIMFTSDNGYYTGEHRQRQGKIKPHEPVIHVPLLVAGPDVPRGVRRSPVTTFDLTDTILDIAGATLPKTDGESKADLIYGKDRGWTYPMLTEGLIPEVRGKRFTFTGHGLTEVGVRTGRWKFVRYANGDQELYDLLRDPLELTSRIGQPEYAGVQREMRRLWNRYQDCFEDLCRLPLPAKYRTTVAELAEQNQAATRDARRYYDN